MNYNILKTGSKGNAIIVENKFLLDCGVSYKEIKPYLKDIKLIFISHCHTDHLNKSTIHTIAYNYPNIKFLVGEYLVDILISLGVLYKNVITVKDNRHYNLGLCQVILRPLVHDVPNRCLCLFYQNKSLIYIVDTGEIPSDIKAIGYDTYLVEANYESDEKLDEEIAKLEEKGEFTYYHRVKKTHLSQVQALNWLMENMGDNSEYEFIHKHIEKGEIESDTGDNIDS